ncbi:MAG: hypothetical protein HN617_15435 [Planctomycetaceae bacterium]|jgi:hypothetical protein|nr:hypothetical protein [Planctomycetaceae bacterium]MBT4725115.1 hypothetical protein [Planctomycetaceae bacterium]MBT4844483.1 hypothetical protein [Planctomycetaceae bacterium]MBT5124033.1 hypothetical protein [Planctomycetaceae bacterium]MBT5597574.1 hypothetical protein [Planctomycetaceae bacterium]
MATTSITKSQLPSSITRWIHALRGGDEIAAHSIWNQYIKQLSIVARNYLKTAPQRMADEEDVVVKAFNSFFKGVKDDRFERLNSREDLWQILIMLTSRHAISQAIAENCKKRGGGNVHNESALSGAGLDNFPTAISAFSGESPTPEFVVTMLQQCQYLLDSLPNALLRDIALLRFEGFACAEIAKRINRSERTVQRKLASIRRQWTSVLENELHR